MIKDRRPTYAAAHNAHELIKDGTPVKLEFNKMAVGLGGKTDAFTLFSIGAQEGESRMVMQISSVEIR